jgi:hypothetical protein
MVNMIGYRRAGGELQFYIWSIQAMSLNNSNSWDIQNIISSNLFWLMLAKNRAYSLR